VEQETGAPIVTSDDATIARSNERAGLDAELSAGDRKAASHSAAGNLTFSQVLVGVYLFGIAVFLLRQLTLYLSFRHSARRWYREVTEGRILTTLEDLRHEMGIEKQFKVRICRKIISPMITGLFRPTLLLPHEEYEKTDLTAILYHELIHYRRNDLWFKLLLICANALHWFNPFIYVMVGAANRDIEISCDEEVLKGADLSFRKRYSERILELMQGNNRQEAPVSTNFHGGKGMMKNRIRHIFDERAKKKGIPTFLLILSLVLVFSACRFDIGQNQWEISPSSGNMSLDFDLDGDGSSETEFRLLVDGETAYLTYKGKDGDTVRKQILNGVEPGFDYSLHAANLEDLNSIAFIVAVDYRGMPFGSGYWEIYSWNGSDFKQIETKPVEENLQMKILEPAEIRDNIMNAGSATYLYDSNKYPADYPSVGLYFKDGLKDGGKALTDIIYAPMSEYDVEGYRTWGQGAVNKIMTGMDFIPGTEVKGWKDPSLSLLAVKEVVFITLPNITAEVTRYYQYRDGRWTSVDGFISDGTEETL
jgi:beta-lactamase regulating signal transducer with metallopeptidase domain